MQHNGLPNKCVNIRPSVHSNAEMLFLDHKNSGMFSLCIEVCSQPIQNTIGNTPQRTSLAFCKWVRWLSAPPGPRFGLLGPYWPLPEPEGDPSRPGWRCCDPSFTHGCVICTLVMEVGVRSSHWTGLWDVDTMNRRNFLTLPAAQSSWHNGNKQPVTCSN